MASCPAASCQYFLNPGSNASIPPLQPNPDVSGIGVLVGFVGTAYATFILLLAYYLLDLHLPSSPRANTIDAGILKWIWRGHPPELEEKWTNAIQKSILMLSDQQIVTGIAILVGGYSQLRCGISSYHWETIISLAWFSSFTHLTTLTVLRSYFHQYRALRFSRVFLMLTVAIMLAIALIPAGSGYWFDIFVNNENYLGINVAGVPAVCFFRALSLHEYPRAFDQGFSMAVSLILIVFGYSVRCVQLFDASSSFALRSLRTVPGNWWKRSVLRRTLRHVPKSRLRCLVGRRNTSLAAYVLVKAIADLLESILWEILWLAFVLAWGTVRLIRTRQSISGTDNEVVLAENFWGFGQIVPVLLLGLPLPGLAEIGCETWLEKKHAEAGPATSLLANSTGVNIPSTPSPVVSTSQSLQIDNSNISSGSYDRDFYQYEWFRALVILLVLWILLDATWFLYELAANPSLSSSLELLVIVTGPFIFPLILLIIFVVLILSIQDYPLVWFSPVRPGQEYNRRQKLYLRFWTCFMFAIVLGMAIFILWGLGYNI